VEQVAHHVGNVGAACVVAVDVVVVHAVGREALRKGFAIARLRCGRKPLEQFFKRGLLHGLVSSFFEINRPKAQASA
jgi:hypothetical protein